MVRSIIIISVFLSLSAFLEQEEIAFAQDPYSGTGVVHYTQPAEPSYRALFGFGGNAGVGGLTPLSFIGNISYEFAPSVLSAGFILSNDVSNTPPHRTYTEFDLLYGIALDHVLPHYGGASDEFHAALSAGISGSVYQTRFHNNYRRSSPPPPDSIQNTSLPSLGLPIQLQAIYEPFRYLGIGALLFYTISTLQPSYGGAVVVEVRY
jgi:hypothetical protein